MRPDLAGDGGAIRRHGGGATPPASAPPRSLAQRRLIPRRRETGSQLLVDLDESYRNIMQPAGRRFRELKPAPRNLAAMMLRAAANIPL